MLYIRTYISKGGARPRVKIPEWINENATKVKVDFTRHCRPRSTPVNTMKWPASCFKPEQFAKNPKIPERPKSELVDESTCPLSCEVDKMQIIDVMKDSECFPDGQEKQSRSPQKPRLTGNQKIYISVDLEIIDRLEAQKSSTIC